LKPASTLDCGIAIGTKWQKVSRFMLVALLIDAGINLSQSMPVLTNIQPVSRTIRRQSDVVLTNKGFTASAVAAFVGCCISTPVPVFSAHH